MRGVCPGEGGICPGGTCSGLGGGRLSGTIYNYALCILQAGSIFV